MTGPGVRARRGGQSAAAVLQDSPYWERAWPIVLVMMAVVAIRMHELFPLLHFVKPVFTLTIACIILLWTHSARQTRSRILRYPLARSVVLYYVYIVVSVPLAVYNGQALGVARYLFPAVLLFLAFYFCPPRRDQLDRLQIGFVVILLIYSAYVHTFGSMRNGRLIIGLGSFDSNDMASIMALSLPLALGIVARAGQLRVRVAGILAAASLGLGVIATGSRGGTLALAAGVLVYVAGLKGVRGFFMVLAIVVAGGLAWVTAPANFRARIQSLTNLDNDYNMTSDTGRKAVWARGRQYFREHPVFGYGAGGFQIAEAEYNARTGRTGKWSAAHNAYLQAFVELGSIGGLLFIAILLTAARVSWRLYRPPSPRGRAGRLSRAPPRLERPEYLASLAAFATGAYFLSHAYFVPIYAVLGLIALAQRVLEAEAPGVDNAGQVGPARLVAPFGERGGLRRAGIPRMSA